MPIQNVTIVVRLEGGGIKKAVFDGQGNVIQGDVSVLEDERWAPKGVGRAVPPPPPKAPSINVPFDMPVSVATTSDAEFEAALADLGKSNAPMVDLSPDDIPDL